MTSPCHVLSVVGNLGFGGDENRLASIVRFMDPAKFRFSVLVLAGGPDMDSLVGSLRSVIEGAGGSVHQLAPVTCPGWLPGPAGALVRLARKIVTVTRLIREWRVDLVDARLDNGMIAGVTASVASGRPSVATLYDAKPWKAFPLWWLFRAVTINLTNAIVTDSVVRQQELGRWIWRRSAVAWNIPNGIPVPTPASSAAQVRKVLEIPDEPGLQVIAQVAGLVPYKGQKVLIEAARQVLDRDQRAFFLIIGYSRGEQGYHNELVDLARRLGIAHRVRITPYPGPIGDIWQLVDIHAHASLFDSLPNAILEGMALGKPAIVSAVGGIPEAVEHERTGLVIPPNHPNALAQGLLRLLSRPDEAASFGSAARARYEERYHPAVMVRALEDCFHSVLTKKRPPGGA